MFCVEILIPKPDFKRPSVDHSCKHFQLKEDAEKYIQQIKQELLDNYLSSGSICECDSDCLTVDFLDTEKYSEYVFSNAYMDLDPYSIRIFEIKL